MIANMLRLDGRRALVTGGSSGIGRAIALAFAEFGGNVFVTHVKEANEAGSLEDAASELDGSIRTAEIDLAQSDGVARTHAAAETALGGPIDILVSNVAVQHRAAFDAIILDDADLEWRLNFRAGLSLAQACLPRMTQRGWGRVLFTGSVQSVKANPEMAVYAALKAAQANLAVTLARQVAARGITVNVLAPGAIDTPRNDAIRNDPDRFAEALSRIPAARFGTTTEIAVMALYLASDAGAFMTGQNVIIDGGMSL